MNKKKETDEELRRKQTMWLLKRKGNLELLLVPTGFFFIFSVRDCFGILSSITLLMLIVITYVIIVINDNPDIKEMIIQT